MYSEIGFIFNPSLTLNNNNNTSNIYGRTIMISGSTSDGEGVLIYKKPNATGTNNVIKYLATDVYRFDDSNEDPYISLIRYFGDKRTKALKLRAADFAYLKDLGVYPINRLWILRRYPENAIVPNNILDWGSQVEPISTVIGWMKDKEDNPMLNLSFSEVWTDENKMIDQLLSEILKNEFGFNMETVMAVPGWSQGLLFGMLNAMELTSDFSSLNVPTGNPNVLRQAKTRDIMGQGLRTDLGFTLETCYEQKYINGIDPGMAMLDIITNLLKMGTSDQKFILSQSAALTELLNQVNSNRQSYQAWLKIAQNLVFKFLEGLKKFIEDLGSQGASLIQLNGQGNTNQGENNTEQQNNVISGNPLPNPDSLKSIITGLGETLLIGTITKYRWPLKGSLGLMSGINTTPWHLTIGNPYSPIINIGNIVVNQVDTKFSNDLGFNDMPARIDVTIDAKLGRPLGKQEIEKMFNNGYKRIYSKTNPSSLAIDTEINNATSADGRSTQQNVIDNLQNRSNAPQQL